MICLRHQSTSAQVQRAMLLLLPIHHPSTLLLLLTPHYHKLGLLLLLITHHHQLALPLSPITHLQIMRPLQLQSTLEHHP